MPLLSGPLATRKSSAFCSARGCVPAEASPMLLKTGATEHGSMLGGQAERPTNNSSSISWQHNGTLKFIGMGQTFRSLWSGFPFQRFVTAILDITLRHGYQVRNLQR